MNRRKARRLVIIALAGGALALSSALVLYGLTQTNAITYFYTPSEAAAATNLAPGTKIRLGGLVAKDSVERSTGMLVRFTITDTESTLPVVFNDTLPDLFREGQGVIAVGAFDASGTFVAESVLAKHDETYMPREVADALKEKGVWQEGGKP